MTTEEKQIRKELNKAIQKEIRKDLWKEAKKLMKIASLERCEEFLKYHYEDKGNICCMILDAVKDELVDEEIISEDDFEEFGNSFLQGS